MNYSEAGKKYVVIRANLTHSACDKEERCIEIAIHNDDRLTTGNTTASLVHDIRFAFFLFGTRARRAVKAGQWRLLRYGRPALLSPEQERVFAREVPVKPSPQMFVCDGKHNDEAEWAKDWAEGKRSE